MDRYFAREELVATEVEDVTGVPLELDRLWPFTDGFRGGFDVAFIGALALEPIKPESPGGTLNAGFLWDQ